MKYSLKKEFITGTAIPVSALRSKNSCGIGEFSDLKQFATWCSKTDIDLIQLLPVNDTGSQSSPYSALSAFALHPIYISIMEIPEAVGYKKDFKKVQKGLESSSKVDFNAVRTAKLSLLKKIYTEHRKEIEKQKEVTAWEQENPWVRTYAVFSYLKEINFEKSWLDWDKYRDPLTGEIEELYTKHRDETLFYSWVQYHLEQQLTSASKALEKIGVNLKGDLPILMNVDSAAVWELRDIFRVKNRAGAPPDMFSHDGQNWGFPTYDWVAMEKNDFAWWKDRLKQAAKFYHAYRIDHVLGFFRIWTIPPQYESGSMGYYSPNNYLTIDDLKDIGIADSRLKWMSEPHVPGYELRDSLGLESNEAIKEMLQQIENEDLYLFKPEINSVDDIKSNQMISDEAKEKMVQFFHNIALIKVDENRYTPTWFYHKSRAFYSLSDHEKYQLSELLKSKDNSAMQLWEKQGLKLLKFMKESEDMLVCAEDLGTVPHCVPEVLAELGILGLHVTRWSRKYSEYGEPYIKPTEYKYLSVSTPAVHDSSTVREWWTEVASNKDIPNALGIDNLDNQATPEAVTKMYQALLKTSSQIAMFQFQDLLAIDGDLRRDNIHTERINVPGTVNDNNWSYRMDFPLEELIANEAFNKRLKRLISKRG